MSAGDLETVHKLTDTIKISTKLSCWKMTVTAAMRITAAMVIGAPICAAIMDAAAAMRGAVRIMCAGTTAWTMGCDSLISRMEDIMRGADSKDREVIQRCIDTMRNG